MSDAGVAVSMPCGGMGRCGKCVISFTKGAPEAGSTDRNFLSEAELDAGKRILCRCIVDRDCEIVIDGSGAASEEDIYALGAEEAGSKENFKRKYIAVDLGTTTIVAALVGIGNDGRGIILRTASCVNHQREYGADVISRISAAANEDGAKRLTDTVRADIKRMADELSGADEIIRIYVAGNTTMLYLLLGYDVSELGKYPYKAEHLELQRQSFQEPFFKSEIVTLPGISAFVGADIVSGIYYLDMWADKSKKILFLDLGTNGEMAFWDGVKLNVTSTAAGPVFEGGGITCGVASVPGAISHVTISNGKTSFETIGNRPPIGLCGTGVMEAVSELVRNGIVDENGLLSDEYFEEGYVICSSAESSGLSEKIRVTAQDVRNVQLAKAAIRTGIDKITAGREPDIVFVAGGFGTNIDAEKIKSLSLFPDSFVGKIKAVGNTCLKGLTKIIEKEAAGGVEESISALYDIARGAKEIVLAEENDFGESYIKALSF